MPFLSWYSGLCSTSEKSSPVINEYGGDNLAVRLKFDPPTGKIGLVKVLFLDSAMLYAILCDSPLPKVKSPVN